MDNKAIKNIKVVERTSKKGTVYAVAEVELINGIKKDIIISNDTLTLIDFYGRDKVKFNYVERLSKDNKTYQAIELSLPEYSELLFLPRQITALINAINSKK